MSHDAPKMLLPTDVQPVANTTHALQLLSSLIKLHAIAPGAFVLGHLEIVRRKAKRLQDAVAQLL